MELLAVHQSRPTHPWMKLFLSAYSFNPPSYSGNMTQFLAEGEHMRSGFGTCDTVSLLQHHSWNPNTAGLVLIVR